MKNVAFRLLDALGFSLSFAFLGATLGLGCYFLHPAQYRSSARVLVNDRGMADSVRAAALSPGAASAAIVAADLFHSSRKPADMAALIQRLRLQCRVAPVGSRGMMAVDLAVTYGDAQMARKAVDTILRVILPVQPGQLHPSPGFATWPPTAGAATRTSGFEPGAAILFGLIAGLLVHSVLTQFQYSAKAEAGGPAEHKIRLKLLFR